MRHTGTWTDIYGSVRASFEGRVGGHRWLVAAPPGLAAGVPAGLTALDGKGRADFLVHDGLTPLLAALRELEPRGVLVVAGRPLASGPAVSVPERVVDDLDGAPYQEGGEYPAWHSALPLADGAGESEAASAVAGAGVPVVVTAPDGVCAALEAWMDATPHGR
ncbi:hypothetical protein DAETH_03270 [Deinococcus aetherius]|uniref:Uncharacterized protein n=1 Tax=Deinococcus aetherius TaxID=200252 RepID=A0ABM8A9R8_9DEIO|nr:hypothetical protein [Deinococcus aetherius]BDP40358.1 hypothetical protein DAETH_03270 [Deinococcus aetherius]